MKDKSEPQDKGMESEKPSNPENEPSTEQETFTRDQVNEFLQAYQGRKDKEIASLTAKVTELSSLQTQLNETQARLKEIDEAKEKAELEAAADDPDLMATIKRRQDIRRELHEFEQQKKELSTEIAQNEDTLSKLNELGKWDEATKLAKEFGVDAETILKFGAETPEEMRTYAERYSKVLKGTGEKLPRPEKVSGEPQSWRDLSPEEKIRKAVSG